MARELGCEFVEASAKNCINVEKAFFDVVRIIRRQNAGSYGSGPSRTANGAAPGRRDTVAENSKYRNKRDRKCVIL